MKSGPQHLLQNAGPKFSVLRTKQVDIDAEMVLKATVKKPTVALVGLEFTLTYDSKFVKASITENNENKLEMNELISSAPNGWEQISSHKEGIYTFRFAMLENSNDTLDKDGELVLEIPFTVQAAGSFGFEITSKDIIAIADDNESSAHSGKGSSISVVAASEAQKIGIELKGNDTANEKGEYALEIEALNLGDTSGIIALEFEFTYDKDVFSPIVKTNENEEMNIFMKNMPGDWEQMCSFDEAKSKYTLRFAAKNAESLTADILKSGERLTVSIPFSVIGSEGTVAAFMVESASVIGINCVNGILSGSGSVKSVSIEKAPAIEKPEFVRGDANGSGDVEKYDYILVKRYCMSTIVLSDTQMLAADANDNGEIEKYDYILIKRHCLGTFTIKADN